MWLTRFGDDKASRQLDDFDLHEICRLGFWNDTACASVSADGASNRVRPRSFVHCCFEEGALVPRPFRKEAQLTTIKVTQEQDFRSEGL